MTPKQIAYTEKVCTFLSADVLRKLREVATEKGLTVSALIRVAIMEYLKRMRGETNG
jgi:predicted transcriptional regulator